MKKILRLFFLLTILFVVSACKKERAPDPDTDYMVYSNSVGIIGAKGGKIMFSRIESPLNGANVIIPEGALSEKTEIRLEMDNSIRSTLDTLANILRLEPDGLVFKKPVQLKMVRKDLANPRVYCFLPDSDSAEEIHITYIDGNDGFVTVELNHFSHYFATERENAGFEANLSQTPSSMKADLRFGGVLNEITTLSRIPVRKLADLKKADITNALEAISAVDPAILANTLHANIEVTLMEAITLGSKEIKKLNFDVYRLGDNVNNFKIRVVQNYPASGKVFNTGIVDLQTLEDFFSGKALAYNFGLNSLPGKKYQLSLSWLLLGGANGDQKLTCRYKISSFNDHVPWGFGYNMSSVDNDTNNNFINDSYDKFMAY